MAVFGVVVTLMVVSCLVPTLAVYTCISSCVGLSDGDYQSCIGCTVYATCSNETLFDNRPCNPNLVWDDNNKTCNYTSPSCSEDPIVEVATGSCITSCVRVPTGNYQSCTGCNVYATCSNGVLYDDRLCPGNLEWDDSTKRCESVSTTCDTSAP